MKKLNRKILLPALVAGSFLTFSCSDDPEPIVLEGIEKSSLIFTEISGEGDFGAHGDHFHGIATATEGESSTIEFDSEGNAVSGGHLHLHADGIYKLEMRAWDYQGNRVEGNYLKDKATADLYKAFLVGGDLVLNPSTADESGAVFQPREQTYGDGTAVSGQYETTGILGYFTLGESNEGETLMISYVLREFTSPETKGTITRTDWNANDYATRFPGKDVLTLDFEIHAGDDH